ncbi:hypothetical protein [Streptomyces hirsutus]|uniref:hypothetical protein n=1 Tax=Streptomyces hirsutus TaxID=35620 RepID=UPI00364B922B
MTHTISAALSAESAASLQGFLQFGPLPDATQDPAAFGAEIQRRLNLVYRLAQDVQGELKQEEKARQAGDQQASETLSARIAVLDEESKRAAIRGLREQVIGFFFVALGLVVQSIVDLVF